MSAEQNITRPN